LLDVDQNGGPEQFMTQLNTVKESKGLGYRSKQSKDGQY
jgi:hypothetical protein